MKGTPEAPRCGFSARTVAALDTVGKEFAAVDILPDPRIRQELSAISGWPTIRSSSSRASWSAARTSSWRWTKPASSPRRSASPRPRRPRAQDEAESPDAAPLQIENKLS